MIEQAVEDELRQVVRGRVVVTSAPDFDDAVRGFNPAVRHEPDVVVLPLDVPDAIAAVEVATRHGSLIQTQSSGHGPSVITRGGLLLRTGGLRGIEIDPAARTARVGAGVIWRDLLDACADHHLAPLGFASVASVGVAGYLLGGGMGPLGRRDGFGADHVVAVELVGADGRLREVDVDHEPDLFWAARGGRLLPAVVTAFTLRLQPAPELFVATAGYEAPSARAGLAAYAEWQRDLNDLSGSTACLMAFPDVPALPEQLRGRRFLQVDLVHTGDEHSGRSVLERLTSAHPPTSLDARPTRPAEWMNALPPVPAGPSWQRGVLLERLDHDVVDTVIGAVGPEAGAPWQVVEIRPFGGALGRPPVVPNAVGGRTDGVLLSCVAPTPQGSDGLEQAFMELTGQLSRWSTPGLNVNFAGPEDHDHPLRAAWSAATYDRMAEIRQRYDPNGVFPAPAD